MTSIHVKHLYLADHMMHSVHINERRSKIITNYMTNFEYNHYDKDKVIHQRKKSSYFYMTK